MRCGLAPSPPRGGDTMSSPAPTLSARPSTPSTGASDLLTERISEEMTGMPEDRVLGLASSSRSCSPGGILGFPWRSNSSSDGISVVFRCLLPRSPIPGVVSRKFRGKNRKSSVCDRDGETPDDRTRFRYPLVDLYVAVPCDGVQLSAAPELGLWATKLRKPKLAQSTCGCSAWPASGASRRGYVFIWAR